MVEILPAPQRLRASRLSGFSCFHTLQWKASLNFSPLLLPKRRTRFRVLAKLDSDADFGIVSSAKCSDGSTVFKFGNVKDRETVVAGVDVGKADEAAAATEISKKAEGKKIKKKTKITVRKVVSRSERRLSSGGAEVSGGVKTVLGGDSGVANTLTVGVFDSNLSTLDTNEVSFSSKDDVKHTVATKDGTLEVNMATGKNVEENSAKICENDVIVESITSEVESVAGLNEESADPKIASFSSVGTNNSNVNAAENIFTETPAKAPLEEETGNDCSFNILEIVTPDKASLEEEMGNSSNANAVENVSGETPANATLETEMGNNGNVNIVEEVSTGPPAKAPLERETEPSSVNGHIDANESRNPVQLDHNRSCANEEEVGTSKADTSEYKELPTPEVECQSIEDTPNREEISTGYLLSSGAVSLHNTSEGWGGVGDAYFVAENWLGVADGVGHWTLEGVSDALFTRELVENCEKNISQGSVDLRDVLVRSVAETASPGSSTILIGHYDGQAFHVVNVGDSGFMVIRHGVVFQKSLPVVHEFNFPLHVESGHDPTEHIEAYRVNLDEGDLIVTATDGLFDNLYDHDILSIVSESLEFNAAPQDIAESLATKALEMGRSSSSRSPFADAAQAAGYAGYSGGKLDDVVVIVSIVQTKHTTL